jgi:hypothetical protein
MNVRPIRLIPLLLLSATSVLAQPRSASVNPDARATEIGRAFQRYQEQLRALISNAEEPAAWWKTTAPASITPTTREKLAVAEREFHDAVRGPLGAAPITSAGWDWRYSFLPEAKQMPVAYIDQIYLDRSMEIRREAPNVRLPGDGEKLKSLAAARERALLAILTADEFQRLELRTSSSSTMVRQRFGEAIESEEEFRKIFLLQKAFDEKFPIEDALYSSRQQDAMRQRNEAERKLLEEIQTAVGAERFVALRRAMDQDFQSLRAIVRRLKLPESTVEAAIRIRDNYAAQSLTINSETSLSHTDRRALLQDLGKEARKELTDVITPAGLDTYGVRAQWLRYLEQGQAFSTNPKDSTSTYFSATQSTFMVMPGGMTLTPPSSSSSSPRPSAAASSSAQPGSTEKSPQKARPKSTPKEPEKP